MKANIKTSLYFLIIGVIAGFFTLMMQVPNLPQETIDEILKELPFIEILYVVGAVQIGVLSFILSFAGQTMLPKTEFTLFPKFKRKTIIFAFIIGVFGAFVITISDAYLFKEAMSSINEAYEFSFLYFIASVLYGGIIEEVIMRLFLLTGIVYLLRLISKTDKVVYTYIAIIISSFLFGLGHLPAMQLLTPLTTTIIIRTITINMIPALGFGFLYTKHGLSYSIIAHISLHIVLQLVLGPIFL